MELKVRRYEELSVDELYAILKARSEVFVVEQQCAYQDVDGRDAESLHVFLEEGGEILAYLRIFPRTPEDASREAELRYPGVPGGGTGCAQIGRVLTTRRGEGLGGRILKEGVRLARERFSPAAIYLEAQVYALGFYEREGFERISGEFLEDGIPHAEMMLRMN